MDGIIDYAGIYPPANLSLEKAFTNFCRYRSTGEAWMLSRFVIPARRLVELPGFVDKITFSAVSRGGIDLEDFEKNISEDISDIKAFNESGAGIVDVFEAALPASELKDKYTANEIVNRVAERLNRNGITVFFESPFGVGWEERTEKLIRALKKVKDKHVGLKLRTGGITSEAFPSTAQVAWAIFEVRDAGVPMKCTAGLHHPIRHYNESVKTKMHGFLNVFGAGILAYVNRIPPEEIQSVLEEENPANFIFDENGFEWKGLRVSNTEISKARHFFTAFGSCSFDEPRADLQELELL